MFEFFLQKRHEKKAEQERLIKFKNDLSFFKEEMPRNKEGALEYTLKFFNVVSEFQDQGRIKFAKNADEINFLVARTGRQGYGWNRTEKGEKVTADNLYLGNVWGLFTHTAKEWMNGDGIYKDFYKRFYHDHNSVDPFDWQVIMFHQVEPFIVRNVKELCDALDIAIKC